MTDKLAYSVVQYLYNRLLRPHLPRKIGMKNEVAVRDNGLFDLVDVSPNAEQPCVSAIQHHVESGDSVCIIGGGAGITPVHAARQGGEVTVYEAARQSVELVRETAELNTVADQISVCHAVVGDAIEIRGDTIGIEVHPDEIPECDYLEIDCEGAEVSILQGLSIKPRTITVEYHPFLGVSRDQIIDLLHEKGYAIINSEVEVPNRAIVITAKYREI